MQEYSRISLMTVAIMLSPCGIPFRRSVRALPQLGQKVAATGPARHPIAVIWCDATKTLREIWRVSLRGRPLSAAGPRRRPFASPFWVGTVPGLAMQPPYAMNPSARPSRSPAYELWRIGTHHDRFAIYQSIV